MNVKEYLDKVPPKNVIELLPRDTLEYFLSGFSEALGAGIALIYPRDPMDRARPLPRLDGLRDKKRLLTFRPLCRCWRSDLPDGCGQELVCSNADENISERYFDEKIAGPRVYRCIPLHLWDMTYPLIAGNRVIGVLFGGQLVVVGDVDWHKELSSLTNYIDWSTCPARDNQLDDVRARIKSYSTSVQGMAKLGEMLDNPQPTMVVSIEDFGTRVRQFLEFGEKTQDLFTALYRAHKAVVERNLVQECDTDLDVISLTDEMSWWAGCEALFREMVKLPEIETIHLYARDGARYRRMASAIPASDMAERLSAREVVPAFPLNQLVAINRLRNQNLHESLGLRERLYGFRSENGQGRELCSTLILITGSLTNTELGLIQDLCAQICASADFAQLLFRERSVDIAYRKEVRLIGHSFRTPLLALQYLLEDLRSALSVQKAPELLAATRRGLERLFDARQELQILLESPARQQDDIFDLVELLNYVCRSMLPIADKHPCILLREREPWPIEAPVRGIRYRVQRALTNLLDNAIKYSYVGIRRETGKPHEVRVWLTISDGYARIMMENYGIGFTKEKLEALAQYGLRGEVDDRRVARTGYGLGLPLAIEVFEQLGGWIHIMSAPASWATEEERRTYHRYITQVEAALPIAKRS
jgi:signal transduction histidine kinase